MARGKGRGTPVKVIKLGTAIGHVMYEIMLAGAEGADSGELLSVYLAYGREDDHISARKKLLLGLRSHEKAGNLARLGRREGYGRPIVWQITDKGRASFVGSLDGHHR